MGGNRMLKSGRGEFGQKVTQAAALEATSPPILTALHLFHQISSQQGESKGNQNKSQSSDRCDSPVESFESKDKPTATLYDFTLCVIGMHQNMLISLFETPFDHFHFHPTS